jgi:isoquinoline 1-oxidoreductase subunit beta
MHFLNALSAQNDVALANPLPHTTRRGFLVLAGAGLSLALLPTAACSKKQAARARGLAQTFLKITPDNKVTVFAKHLEMGQGTWSGLASIVAEELDADWAQMHVEGAPAKLPDYGNIAWGGAAQGTGGSTAIANSYTQLREAGATARAMLVGAAAKEWSVPTNEIKVAKGMLSHASGKSASFGALAELAAKEPVPKSVSLKDPAQFQYLGKGIARLDMTAKSQGRQQFGIDVQMPNMKIAVVARAPRFGAKVVSYDASAAKAIQGVSDVVQIPSGVAVLASTTWAALKGREALKVTWDEAGAEKRSSTDLFAEYEKQSRTQAGKVALTRGDSAKALSSAAQVLEAEFRFPYLAHAPMEPMSGVAWMEGGAFYLKGGVQLHTVDQANAARILGLKPEDVHLITLHAGGSFGRRANPLSDWVSELAHLVKATKGSTPIKVMWTREDDIKGGLYRPMGVHKIQAALDAKGKIISWNQQLVGQSILNGTPFAGMMKDGLDPTAFSGNACEQYAIPNAQVRWIPAQTGVPVLWWRSVEHTHTAFSKEVMMDELAQLAGEDPLAFRLAHLDAHPRHKAVLQMAADKAGWGKKLPKGQAMGLAVHESFGSFVAQVVQVALKADGSYRVERVVCAVDCGFAINPDVVKAQMEGGLSFGLGAALHGKITLAPGGAVEQSNFDSYPVLRMDEAPRAIEVFIVNSGNAPTGVGEPGTPPIAAALANALARASGKSVRSLPLDDLNLKPA